MSFKGPTSSQGAEVVLANSVNPVDGWAAMGRGHYKKEGRMRTMTSRGLGAAIVLCALTLGLGMPAFAAKADQVKGEVLIVTDDFYLIKERNGKGVQVHLDKSTKRSGAIKVGDNVEAQVSVDGRALSIKLTK
jgi:hypothetical protein